MAPRLRIERIDPDAPASAGGRNLAISLDGHRIENGLTGLALHLVAAAPNRLTLDLLVDVESIDVDALAEIEGIHVAGTQIVIDEAEE